MSTSETITRNDLTNILNEVITSTSVNYVVETHIEPLTIATNAYVETTFTATKSGYFPLGIVGYRIGWVSGETGKCNVYSLKMTNKSEGSVTVAYAVYNVTSASVSMNLQVDILWAKVDGASVSLQADYVVDEGTSGIWTYRKWNSGVAECWTYIEGNSASDGRWHINPTLPSFFSAALVIVNVNYWSSGYTTTSAGYTRTNLTGSTWSIDAYMYNGAPNAISGAYVSAKGRWK